MTISPSKAEIVFWQQTASELLKRLNTTTAGLSSSEATDRLKQVGPNMLRPPRKRALFLQFLARFKNPLVILLLVASAVSAFTGDLTSFLIISVIVVMSVTLDFIQEHHASKAAEELRQSVSIRVQVLRDGKSSDIPAATLVPGDVVSLSAGDLIPGDGRVLAAKDFFVKQALLTGESYPIEKFPRDMPDAGQNMADAVNAVFMGTSVVSGSAMVLICRTGPNTSLGEISDTLTTKAPPTSFEQGTQRFGLLIMRFTILLVLFVILANAFFHRPWLESFLFAVALAVGLTPELLPMVVSVTLARGAMRMAKKKVIVKRLESIHNLGSMDVLCTDKTGTLTEARIHLERHVDSLGRDSSRVLELAYLNSYFESGLRSPMDDAILEHKEIDIATWKKIDEVPFDFERRRVSVIVDNGQKRLLVVKGASEDILRLSTHYEENGEADLKELDKTGLARIQTLAETFARNGFRVLGVAWKRVESIEHHAVIDDETALIFAGFAAFLDPPKESAQAALVKLTHAGVAVKIVTGDNELVTRHICEKLGVPITGILTGEEMQGMEDHALSACVENMNLFCRVNPAQKNRVILALKQRGRVVGYMGDGINDAPSLHSADIGVSVDSAVDVAKSAAEMILLEQDLNVLHDGVVEGRRTYGNIMKYIMMGTSSNFGNMFSMAGATLFLPFLPMLPVQILLNNLLYDVSEIPIPLDSVDEEYLTQPRHWNMDFIRNFMLFVGPVSSVFDFLTFYIMLHLFQAGEQLFHTGWFIESMATQVLVIFIIRTRRNPFKSRPNIWLTLCSISVALLAVVLPFTSLGTYFGFVTPPLSFYAILAGLVLFYLFAVEGIKQWFFRRFAER
ncbi:MAG TPA: magnesium-translocating P-type ATPase [Nitrospirota bacterium]|nr:magnesium-translocating P-type ATPase [Nitrospirota bacterium]